MIVRPLSFLRPFLKNCLKRADLVLGYRLGLPLTHRAVCHGYQNCCDCSACRTRAERGPAQRTPRKHVKQPWELGKRAA